MMPLWWPPEWAGSGHRLWWSSQLEQSPSLELWALMVEECQAEVVAEVPDAVESDEGQEYAGPTEHAPICRNKVVCVVVSVWNVCTMAQNSVAEMVMEASDVEGASSGTARVVGEAI